MSLSNFVKESPFIVINTIVLLFLVLFFTASFLKKKAEGKPETSSEYKAYKTFKVIMYIILAIIVILGGGIFGPEIFSAGLNF